MKKMILIFCVLAFSCEDDERACYTGTVLGYEMCTDISVIALEGTAPLGKPLTWDNISYPNVIKVPGIYTQGTLYFSMRRYNKAMDEDLLGEPRPCPAVYMPVNVPVFTILASSDQACP